MTRSIKNKGLASEQDVTSDMGIMEGKPCLIQSDDGKEYECDGHPSMCEKCLANSEILSKEFNFRGRLLCIIILRHYQGGYRLSTTMSNGKTVATTFTDLNYATNTYIASLKVIEEEIKEAGLLE